MGDVYLTSQLVFLNNHNADLDDTRNLPEIVVVNRLFFHHNWGVVHRWITSSSLGNSLWIKPFLRPLCLGTLVCFTILPSGGNQLPPPYPGSKLNHLCVFPAGGSAGSSLVYQRRLALPTSPTPLHPSPPTERRLPIPELRGPSHRPGAAVQLWLCPGAARHPGAPRGEPLERHPLVLIVVLCLVRSWEALLHPDHEAVLHPKEVSRFWAQSDRRRPHSGTRPRRQYLHGGLDGSAGFGRHRFLQEAALLCAARHTEQGDGQSGWRVFLLDQSQHNYQWRRFEWTGIRRRGQSVEM